MDVIGLDHEREVFGYAEGEMTSSAAPLSEKFRTVQSMAPRQTKSCPPSTVAAVVLLYARPLA